METACKKNNHTGKTKTSPLFTSSLHILLLFKKVFISLFSASHDTLNHSHKKQHSLEIRAVKLQRPVVSAQQNKKTRRATTHQGRYIRRTDFP